MAAIEFRAIFVTIICFLRMPRLFLEVMVLSKSTMAASVTTKQLQNAKFVQNSIAAIDFFMHAINFCTNL